MTPERIKKLEVLCQGPFGLELLAEVKRLQAELAEEHKKYLLASSDRDNMDAEIQRLRKLALDWARTCHKNAPAWGGGCISKEELDEIGPIEEDKP